MDNNIRTWLFDILHSINEIESYFHDYSDEKKGFIVWKDLLEERLT